MRNLGKSFYITGGTLPRDASSYIARSADTELLSHLRSGEFCFLLTSRQMGKSSLMVQTVARLRQEGVVCAVIDLTAIGQNLDVEQWYGGIHNRLAEQLGLEVEFEEFWFSHSEMGPLDRFMRAIQEVLLRSKTEDIVIFIDEIDAVRSLPFSADEFFASIRACYNRRTENSAYERLTFCLIGVASPTDLIQDTRTTPFNIGKRIDLTDFTLEESRPLIGGMETTNSSDLLNRVMYWTAGHPYLTQRLCQAVAEDVTVRTIRDVDRACGDVFFSAEAREQNDNLLFVRDRLLRSEVDLVGLLETYQAALSGKEVRNNEANPLVSVLRLSGVVRAEQGTLHPRNRIYSAVFDRKWISSNLPGEEVRRQRAAYRRGVLRVGTLAVVVVTAIAILALYSFSQRDFARLSEAKAIAAGKLERQARIEADQNAAGRTAALKEANRQKGIAQNRAAFAQRQRALATGNAAKYLAAKIIADDKTTEANKNLLESQRLIYIASIQTLQAAASNGNSSLVQSILERPDIRGSKFRGWEWGFWDREYHLELVELSHTDKVVSATFSADGAQVLTASGDGTSKIWHAITGRLHATLKGHKAGLSSAAFSPDGSRVVTTSMDATAKIWDARTGKLLAELRHPVPVVSAKFSPDGLRIVTASDDISARVWNARSGMRLFELKGHTNHVSSAEFSPNGSHIVTTSGDGTARIWNASNGQSLFELKGHTAGVSKAKFFTDGSRIVTASEDTTMRIWDVVTGKPLAVLKGHTSWVESVAFSPDGSQIVSASTDHTARVWDASNGTSLAEHKGHTDRVFSAAFSPDGLRVLTASRDGRARVWEASTGRTLLELKGHRAWVTTAAFSPDGSRIVTASSDGKAKIWDTNDRSFSAFKGHTDVVRAAKFSPDGSRVVTASSDQTARVWDVVTGTSLLELKGHGINVWGAAYSRDGLRIVTASGDKTARVWDASTGQSLLELKGHTDGLSDCEYSPDGSRILTASPDKTARVWDAANGRSLAILKGHTGGVYTAAYSPDGSRIVTASFDQTARVWDAATGRCLLELKGHTGRVYDAAFSPDGLRVVTASFDRTARVWSAATGRSVLELSGHKDEVYSAVFSPDGSRILTASGDRTARVWDAVTGMNLVELRGHTDRVVGAAFSSDGSRIVTASRDNTAIVWYSKRKDRLLTRASVKVVGADRKVHHRAG